MGSAHAGRRLLLGATSAVTAWCCFTASALADVGGTQLWAATYDGVRHMDDVPAAIVAVPGEPRVVLTGLSYRVSTKEDYATVAFDTSHSGAQSWSARYAPSIARDSATAIAASPDGSTVFVTGLSDDDYGYGRFDFVTIAYKATDGTRLWIKRYASAFGGAIPHSIAVSPDGSKVFVTGQTQAANSGAKNFLTVAYNSSSGGQLWAKQYDGPGNMSDEATAVAVTPDGTKAIVTGWSQSSTGANQMATVAYNTSTGERVWTVRASDGEMPASIAITPDGSRVIVAATATRPTTGRDIFTVAYLVATGHRDWARHYDGPGHGQDVGQAMAISADGTAAIVTGPSVGVASQDDYATLAYDPTTGAPKWAARYNGPNNRGDEPVAIAVSPDSSKVVVTGSSDNGPEKTRDIATVAYDVGTGTRQWRARYNGPGNSYDTAAGVAVTSDGAAAVIAGSTQTTATGLDFVAVAYAL